MSDPSATSYTAALIPQPLQSTQQREYLFTDNARFSVWLDTRTEKWHSDIKPGHTTHTHFLLSTHPLIHDLTHACNFGPSATNRYYCHAQHAQLSVPFVGHSKFQNNISDYGRISSFKFYLSNTEPFNTLLCN